MIQIQVTLEDIRAWARGKQPDEVLGRAAMAGHCPVANYLKTLLPAPWRVDSVERTAKAGNEQCILDEQVYRLTARLDHSTKGKSLTAYHVLYAIRAMVD